MVKHVIALAALVCSFPSLALAQRAPSPGELNRQMDTLEKDVSLLVEAMAVDLDALRAINRSYEELFDFQAYVAIDRAIEHIDEVFERTRRYGSGEAYFALDGGRRLLLDARRGAYFFDMNELRMRVHYRAVHPLQRRNFQNVLLLQSMSERTDDLERTIDATLSRALAEVARAAGEGIGD